MRRAVRARPRHRSRRGYLYVAVMMVSVMVSVMGFAAIRIAHDGLRTATARADCEEATLLARTAVEFGVNRVDSNATWRTTYVSGNTAETFSLGNGTFEWKLTDDDGVLADDGTDSVWLTGTGRVNDAVVVRRVRLVPAGDALDCLGVPLCVNSNLTVATLVDLTTDTVLHANGNLTATAVDADVLGDASATGTVSGDVSGTSVSGAATRTLPGSDVFDFYLDNGTQIDVDALPGSGANTPVIENLVLAPTVNPFGGGTNPLGIYVVDCGFKTLTVRNCRIVGTLVVLNPGSASGVSGSVHWEPAAPNYPALLVAGSFRIGHDVDALSESTHATNFNPAGVPYHGSFDGDTSDTYPSHLRGIVYTSDTLVLPFGSPTAKIVGCAVTQSVIATSPTEFCFSDVHLNDPPPGFRSGPKMAISPTSWHRDVAP